jgi:hypothetical protein
LKFEGTNEYLEDLPSRIDVPQLDHLDILFTFLYLDRAIVLDTPQLLRFISRIPKFQAPDKGGVSIETQLQVARRNFHIDFWLPGQISSIIRLETFPLPTLECLYIDGQHSVQHQQDNAENTRWLERFRPFTPVKNLFLCMDFAPHIASALQGLVGEGAMEVLPTLENAFIEEFQ